MLDVFLAPSHAGISQEMFALGVQNVRVEEVIDGFIPMGEGWRK